MSLRQWVWLIGMSDASDWELRNWATSFSFPPSLEVQGGRLDFDSYDPQRRALRLHVQQQSVTIKLLPRIKCMNPVFELLEAPVGPLTIRRDGARMSPDFYSWDGRTLWLDATIGEPAEAEPVFGRPARARGGMRTRRVFFPRGSDGHGLQSGGLVLGPAWRGSMRDGAVPRTAAR